uniref:Uncharacterized protein K0023E10.38 n=1 Tax=Oryza sativa subsp. indica TaxID=39946 RepID=C8TEV4_ORYSI|nr:hypothetical protein [Oryza sativa Indica Group]
MATTDATIAHIIDEQEDIKIKSSKCWNLIRQPATLLTSNGRQISIRAPFRPVVPHPSFPHPPPPRVRDQAESECLLSVTVSIYTVILHIAW